VFFAILKIEVVVKYGENKLNKSNTI